ncbi:hypothetical protein H2200_002189 [Cladophialophora chaetospira]|uniref:Uncharacterized protein n=1 Tax=Cladophialophora chaetospira TaxID=386627 RepID=A0AA38XIL8_9EURO|nr:hypothetical protein H2200_002189 [Cladophialophora chaetospira]
MQRVGYLSSSESSLKEIVADNQIEVHPITGPPKFIDQSPSSASTAMPQQNSEENPEEANGGESDVSYGEAKDPEHDVGQWTDDDSEHSVDEYHDDGYSDGADDYNDDGDARDEFIQEQSCVSDETDDEQPYSIIDFQISIMRLLDSYCEQMNEDPLRKKWDDLDRILVSLTMDALRKRRELKTIRTAENLRAALNREESDETF